MGKKSLTRDELFLAKLKQLAEAKGDEFQEINKYVVGQAMGQNNRSVDNIVRMLAQTNFIKKGKEDEDNVYLTKNGIALLALVI